ncbi:PepSY-associated TM helix domain-containing protein [Roseateles amylovorans]|uniref:PepSY domain-containing protein n=1 Tax=Roseateles amylovorans TaxID=2978473 RepID=A0ABY6B076_9BURK|nr:PepSY-associated TM helix domain-containing protein [Roseateles amylovorans]UXH77571.1 PepSY domain-containing protein [Roseateles amylovorans]
MRAFVLKLHLWLGLSIGALFVLLGLTGSALVFYEGLDAGLHPEIRVAATGPAPGWDSPVWDRALATVHARWPDRQGAWRFEVSGPPGALAARYQPPGGGHHGRRVMVWLTPDGTAVLREAEWGGYLMTWLYDLHMELLAGGAGRAFNGWAGLVTAVLLLSGLWAWWPRGSWARALHFKRDAVRTRRLRDIHKLTGLIGLALLLMFVVTGVMLSLPDESNAVLARTVGMPTQAPKVRASATSGIQVPLSRALAAARVAFPQARLAWVESPGPGTGVILVRVQQPSDPSFRFPHSYAYVDPYTAALIAIRDREAFGTADVINNWLHPLHDGSIGGVGLRALWVVSGLLPAVLFITGLWRWRCVRRAARMPRAPTAPGAAPHTPD